MPRKFFSQSKILTWSQLTLCCNMDSLKRVSIYFMYLLHTVVYDCKAYKMDLLSQLFSVWLVLVSV